MNATDAYKYASQGDMTHWRMAIDGIETTNRDIERKSPLYLDRLSMTFQNMGKQLNDLSYIAQHTNDPIDGTTILAIAQPVPQNSRLFELNLYGSAALPATLNVYQEIVRQIQISKGVVSVR